MDLDGDPATFRASLRVIFLNMVASLWGWGTVRLSQVTSCRLQRL